MRDYLAKALLFSFALLLMLTACEKKENGFDPEELVVTIDATAWTNSSDDNVYVVVENKTSSSKYILVEEGKKMSIRRGSEISGDLVNLHFVYIRSIDDKYWKIDSYYDTQLGMEVPLLERNTNAITDDKVVFSKGVTNISFSEIPAFDIATRNAKIPQHAHTLGSLEVPCAAAGGNTYPTGSNFYVSLIDDGIAGYKLITVPGTTDFIIPLTGLNYNMTKYLIPKDTNIQPYISVTATGSEGGIKLFSLNSEDAYLFNGTNIEVFVPAGIPQMQLFSTLFSKSKENGFCASSYLNQTTVPDNYSFLDLGLGISWSPGNFPAVTCSAGNYDYIMMEICYLDEFYINSWHIYSPDCNNISTPEFPSEVIMSISDNSTFSRILENPFTIDVRAVSDSRLRNYDEVVEYFLKTKDLPIEPYTLFTESAWVDLLK